MWKGRTTKLTLDDLDEVPEDNRARQARAPLLAALENTKSAPLFLNNLSHFP